jgi:hypothetical protein
MGAVYGRAVAFTDTLQPRVEHDRSSEHVLERHRALSGAPRRLIKVMVFEPYVGQA